MEQETQIGEVAEIIPAVEAAEVDVKPESSQDKPDEPLAAETDSAEGEKDNPAEKTFTQAELDAILEKKNAKLIRQRDQERTKREELERLVAKATIPHDEGKPNKADYDDVDKYADDVAEWKLNQRAREEQVVQKLSSESSFEAKRDDLLSDLAEIETFDMDKWNKLPISKAMGDAIIDSDIRTKLAVHIFDNPSDLQRIAALSPARQIAEIGKLEERLSAAPKTSKAPAPINPIGNGKTVTTKSSAAATTMEEYIERRKAEGARWAR